MKNKLNIMLIGCLLSAVCTLSFASACQPRLLIGSGVSVLDYHNYARPVQDCDVTVDKNDQLAPHYQFDLNDSGKLDVIFDTYHEYFSEIIFEHVGWGPMDHAFDQQQFNTLLKNYYDLLKPEGVFLYESFKSTSIDILEGGLLVDKAWVNVIEWSYDRIFPDDQKAVCLHSVLDKFEAIEEFYQKAFEAVGFQNVSIRLLEKKAERRDVSELSEFLEGEELEQLKQSLEDNAMPGLVKRYYLSIRAEKRPNEQ